LDRSVKNESPTFSHQLADFLRRHLSWLLGGALALLLLQDIFGTHGLIAMRRSQQETRQAQQEINQLEEENHQLEDRVKALKSDPAAIERIAREVMGLAKPGEYIFKIAPKSGSSTSAPTPAPPSAPATGSAKKP